MGSLDGRVALVTGAGRRKGIGRGIALELARAGADVAVHARAWDEQPWPLEEIAALGRRVLTVEGDLAERGTAARLAGEIAGGLGAVDLLVNNAGIAGGAGLDLLADYDDEQWYRTVDVNLNAVYLVTKAFLPGMVAGDGGAIVNIASIAGRQGQPRMGAYVATKWALIGLTRQLALEYAPAVRVNCVAPGTVDTDEMDKTFARRDALAGTESGIAKAKRVAALPLQRQGRPEDIGKAVAFLASDAADWVTGQTINVDGGQVMS
ncbi:MAG: meso-butanediol dehydrogenase / (S,S)-butanediol dehydrogenase / diacetyl reductase [Solirubrobacteraceae bacterium]|jgi:NAD(P)-dependent dehydrogenase (short-subunit alcohol dehydrogenase family)|nr:meso-butanediol dehydrogenase / (S,S)-butanediol dehydrogenase / diacetyl reductase [Solirubrobacteraceae bacterium]